MGNVVSWNKTGRPVGGVTSDRSPQARRGTWEAFNAADWNEYRLEAVANFTSPVRRLVPGSPLAFNRLPCPELADRFEMLGEIVGRVIMQLASVKGQPQSGRSI